MQKVVALSTLQSLVSEHNRSIYQEALDCIKNELDILAQQTNNSIKAAIALVKEYSSEYAESKEDHETLLRLLVLIEQHAAV